MTGITDGKYRIRLAAEPSPLVGIDAYGPVAPVVTRGEDKIWFIHKLGEGRFALAIDAPGRPRFFVQDAGKNVVAGERPPSAPWVIKGPDGGPYTIQAPARGPIVPVRVWTVDEPYEDKSPVTLELLQFTPQIPENQKWYILRVFPE